MEPKQFKLLEYYNLVIDYLEKNKVSSEEGKIQIDRFVIKCLDNDYQTRFKEPYYLTKDCFEHLKTCFFDEFKPIFTQYYKPVVNTWGGKRLQEFTFSLCFNEKETNMVKDPIFETKRTIDKWIKESLKPQCIAINEARRKKTESEGKVWSEFRTPYLEVILEEQGNNIQIYREPCTGFSLTEHIIKQLIGTDIGHFRITDCKIREEAVTVIRIVPFDWVDPVKKQLEEKVEEVAKKFDIDKFEYKDLITIRFTWQTEIDFNGYWFYQVPKAFWEEKRAPFSLTISDLDIPGYLVDTIEIRDEKEMGYGSENVDFIYVHLRKKIDGGETR